MKVIVYNINQEDKENLALINRKKHKITAIKDPLTEMNVGFATKKDAVIIIDRDISVSALIIQKLRSMGVKFIILWSVQEGIADERTAEISGFKFFTIYSLDSKEATAKTIEVLDHCEQK